MLMADRLCDFCKELDISVLEDEYHYYCYVLSIL